MAEGLLALPQELRIQIMSNLDAISLAHCAMTCKLLYETRQGSSQLEYIVQLYLNGFKDSKTSTAHSEIVQRLLHYRDAWLLLPPNKELEHIAVDLKQPCHAYELVGGAFSDADNEYFEIVQLPTTYASPIIRTASTGTPHRDFAMDPTQDLIVFLEPEEDAGPPFPMATRTLRLHFHTISTSATHPLAQQSPLQFTLPPDPSYGPAILLRIPPFPSIHCSRLRAGSGSIRLYNLLRSSLTTGGPVHLATLHLPPTARGASVFSMSADAGPLEARPQPHMPYMIHDEDRIHAFRAIYQVGRVVASDTSLDLFVHQRVLTKYYNRGMALYDNEPAALPLDVPWAEWGPQNTHVIAPSVMQVGWERSIHGQRVVYPHEERNSRLVDILDFSRAAAQKSFAARDPLYRAMPWNSQHSWDLSFLAVEMRTYLPFATSTVACQEAYSRLMLYADGIVGVKTKYNEDSLLLHVYPISQEEKNPETWHE